MSSVIDDFLRQTHDWHVRGVDGLVHLVPVAWCGNGKSPAVLVPRRFNENQVYPIVETRCGSVNTIKIAVTKDAVSCLGCLTGTDVLRMEIP